MNSVKNKIISCFLLLVSLMSTLGVNMFFHHCYEHDHSDFALISPSNWHSSTECLRFYDSQEQSSCLSDKCQCVAHKRIIHIPGEDLSNHCMDKHLYLKHSVIDITYSQIRIKAPVFEVFQKVAIKVEMIRDLLYSLVSNFEDNDFFIPSNDIFRDNSAPLFVVLQNIKYACISC
ncbi:hypothetical protein K4L44_01365 [Halosquirtibacter laminarini]|uniref:Uncharacterized protein n=1 Tax=Halosquirtibacter laminarini TaxID=3374600 RepID=A0AC61NFZ3_9BACT|nr:hypothetical protein K4L44_01365 [Prolixibacteraceae bacterium]